jgi:hypothetical protein
MSQMTFNKTNDLHVYTLGQAWQVYSGQDVTYGPFEEHIASVLGRVLGTDLEEDKFLDAGAFHWVALNSSYNERIHVGIIEDVLSMASGPEYEFAALGDWIVVLVDKGDNNPDIVKIKRGPDGSWSRGPLKDIDDLE